MYSQYQWLSFGISLCLYAGSWFSTAMAEDTVRYHDILLTQDRICKACQWKLLPKGQVQLTNRQGESIVVPQKEVVGVNNHPWARKIYMKSLYGIGFPAKVIVPYAFDDGQEFVCKYCD